MDSALTDKSPAPAVDRASASARKSGGDERRGGNLITRNRIAENPAATGTVTEDATGTGTADPVNDGQVTDDLAFKGPVTDEALPSGLLADLDDPNLVLSEGYIGSDRRAGGLRARVLRATFSQRRSLLRLELLVVVVVGVLILASVLVVGSGSGPRLTSALASSNRSGRIAGHSRTKTPLAAPPAAAPAVTTPAPTTTTPSPTTTTPAPAVTTPTTAPAPATAPAAAAAPTAPPVDPASLTPAQMGAQALALVRYPWQNIPGYSIQFLPISAAPSPGFYGNTSFTWGHSGGTSYLYVYPGETVQRLAAITAFEIGHEVDAAGVYPHGGQSQIESILNYVPPNGWAPTCDCAEQNYLSGWYAAAFSNFWSPGVGDWSQIAGIPPPSGATTLNSIASWLNPPIA